MVTSLRGGQVLGKPTAVSGNVGLVHARTYNLRNETQFSPRQHILDILKPQGLPV